MAHICCPASLSEASGLCVMLILGPLNLETHELGNLSGKSEGELSSFSLSRRIWRCLIKPERGADTLNRRGQDENKPE